MRVLIPAAGPLARRCAQLLRAGGDEAVVAPVVEYVAPVGSGLQDAVRALAAGEFDWVAFTSARAVAAVVAAVSDVRVPKSPVFAGRTLYTGSDPKYWTFSYGRSGADDAAPRVGAGAEAAAASVSVTDGAPVTAVTHVNAASPSGIVPPGTRVAAVGEATARAAREAGMPVDLMPGEPSAGDVGSAPAADVGAEDGGTRGGPADAGARGLLAVWPAQPGRVLLPQSAAAAPTLAEGLRARGHTVTRVDAYVPRPRILPADILREPFDAVLVTSGVTGRAVAAQVCAPLVSIGPQTSADLAAAGHPPAAEVAAPTAKALVTAARALHKDARAQ